MTFNPELVKDAGAFICYSQVAALPVVKDSGAVTYILGVSVNRPTSGQGFLGFYMSVPK